MIALNSAADFTVLAMMYDFEWFNCFEHYKDGIMPFVKTGMSESPLYRKSGLATSFKNVAEDAYWIFMGGILIYEQPIGYLRTVHEMHEQMFRSNICSLHYRQTGESVTYSPSREALSCGLIRVSISSVKAPGTSAIVSDSESSR